ncbi:MAG: DUF559 domain-containing protein [Deltaproteobacteria bacterium]|jgi:hypothetical protein|nr:DUF559 domain-containing protein [Deltaproteobacteria bacterium]
MSGAVAAVIYPHGLTALTVLRAFRSRPGEPACLEVEAVPLGGAFQAARQALAETAWQLFPQWFDHEPTPDEAAWPRDLALRDLLGEVKGLDPTWLRRAAAAAAAGRVPLFPQMAPEFEVKQLALAVGRQAAGFHVVVPAGGGRTGRLSFAKTMHWLAETSGLDVTVFLPDDQLGEPDYASLLCHVSDWRPALDATGAGLAEPGASWRGPWRRPTAWAPAGPGGGWPVGQDPARQVDFMDPWLGEGPTPGDEGLEPEKPKPGEAPVKEPGEAPKPGETPAEELSEKPKPDETPSEEPTAGEDLGPAVAGGGPAVAEGEGRQPVSAGGKAGQEARKPNHPEPGQPHPGSPGENVLHDRLSRDPRLAGLFLSNWPVEVEGEEGWSCQPDFFWPEGGLVVEVDGFVYHRKHKNFVQDRWRDYLLTVGGCTVLRLTHEEVSLDVDLAVEKVAKLVELICRRQSLKIESLSRRRETPKPIRLDGSLWRPVGEDSET